MKRKALIIVTVLNCIYINLQAQTSAKTDSVVQAIMSGGSLTGSPDKGNEMMLHGNYSAAGDYYNDALKKDEGNINAYFGRGVVNLIKTDTANACRDWSAVLALGDTATFKLLDAHCHGSAIIEDDVIPKDKNRKMFTQERKGGKVLADASKAKTVVEVMPQFPGGDEALLAYLQKNLKYPPFAKTKAIQGTVYVNFIISSKGTVLFPYIVRGIGYGCDQEALRLVKSMPAWKPGRQKGKPVLVRYNMPVKFSFINK